MCSNTGNVIGDHISAWKYCHIGNIKSSSKSRCTVILFFNEYV